MRIFRETCGSKEMKATELYSNATMNDWIKITDRARSKASVRPPAMEGRGHGSLMFYPESPMSFSVQINSGKKFRFRRTN